MIVGNTSFVCTGWLFTRGVVGAAAGRRAGSYTIKRVRYPFSVKFFFEAGMNHGLSEKWMMTVLATRFVPRSASTRPRNPRISRRFSSVCQTLP
jgi:hypothetical protein